MLLPGISTDIVYSLLNHMTIITKVGVSYIDHMNDDAPGVDSFSHGCYQSLSSPRFEERPWEWGYVRLAINCKGRLSHFVCQSFSLRVVKAYPNFGFSSNFALPFVLWASTKD